ncbi:type III pantothenate kinase [Iodobacter ciconiae]|uniref:Type III pantothenate kinase n=1 Tax=Iodobacter ciconiae TaxID=2496266 RepID=A0A3S8ZP24_9NEIS|nr:type III pantothenate kinase [Iodobacter ciconiae]AZN35226.1 type III pantothenate kinase [Iodobacter ciconiae]
MNTLLIDLGNTRIKWAHCEGDLRKAEGFILNTDFEQLLQKLSLLPRPQLIYGCTVGAPQLADGLDAFCQTQWQRSIEWLQVSRQALGIHNSYRHLEQQGPDRWAAVLGARSLFPEKALLIASAGTALTVDALTEDNEFLGGMILPGLRLMKSALAQQTERLTVSDGAFHDFPRCTTDAIHTGCLSALAGSIITMHARLSLRGDTPLCILSGGDAATVAPLLSAYQPIIAEQLVLHGLAALARNNAS